jgi:hypothetical protein
MKYDDAEWYFLNFERELENEAGGTHIGMYFAWAVLKGLGSNEHAGTGRALDRLKKREATGQEVFFDYCDGKLTDDDFNDQGNAFTQFYYEKSFAVDFAAWFKKSLPNTGHPVADGCSLPDTWENYDRLVLLLDRRYKVWCDQQLAASNSSVLSLVPIANPEAESEPVQQARPEPFDMDTMLSKAQAGDADAWYQIGCQYILGEKIAQSVSAATDAFQKGANLGSFDAMFNLGVSYQDGSGVAKDAAQALHWFAKAADGGHPRGFFMLGMAYRKGELVQKDVAVSNALIVMAHHKGVAEAGAQGVIAGTNYSDIAKEFISSGKVLAILARRHGSAPGLPSEKRAPSASAALARPSHSNNKAEEGDENEASNEATQSTDWLAVGLVVAGLVGAFIMP